MVEQFLNHIHRHQLCKTTDKILLAVSGGVDSMVMLELFRQTGFPVGVAHINYQLRGGESDSDQKVVADYCAQYSIPFHIKVAETTTIAAERKESIQLTAREIRYGFFRVLVAEGSYQKVATAHHLNDSIEWVVFNLTRGTGMDGLTGIPVRNSNIIRPMLFATKNQITEFARQHSLVWREDSSNASDDYSRNFVRHHIIPELKKLNPAFEQTFQDTLERLGGSREILKRHLQSLYTFDRETRRLFIDRKKLESQPATAVALWEILKSRGFNFDQAKAIVEQGKVGSQHLSEGYRLTIDRHQILVDPIGTEDFAPVKISPERAEYLQNGKKLVLSFVDRQDFILENDSTCAQLDADKLNFPLSWRRWRDGDSLQPLGMSGQKKVSDLLIDLKIPRPDKQDVTIVEADNKTVWVVGLRVDDRYKVSDSTTRVLIMRVTKV